VSSIITCCALEPLSALFYLSSISLTSTHRPQNRAEQQSLLLSVSSHHRATHCRKSPPSPCHFPNSSSKTGSTHPVPDLNSSSSAVVVHRAELGLHRAHQRWTANASRSSSTSRFPEEGWKRAMKGVYIRVRVLSSPISC
jgi:hypothetical protein